MNICIKAEGQRLFEKLGPRVFLFLSPIAHIANLAQVAELREQTLRPHFYGSDKIIIKNYF